MRIFCREYEVNETNRVAYELEATAVGHGLSRGRAAFEKAVRGVAFRLPSTPRDCPPTRASTGWILAEPDGTANADGEEVVPRELVEASWSAAAEPGRSTRPIGG